MFKPPITPEKYWDPEIGEFVLNINKGIETFSVSVVEANDPREQTQYGQPLRSR